jgi:NAD(P)-dependent dehydrogenase (short-subunit alcohol dehydrogenase family)
MSDLKDAAVFVTGALTGIGRATVLAFVREGARVVFTGRRDDAGRAFEAELRRQGGDADYVKADMTREEQLEEAVDRTISRFGRLDVAVNNAATDGYLGPLVDATASQIREVIETNLVGTMLAMKFQISVMKARRSGSIVNVGSVLGHRAARIGVPYIASKFAVEGMTKAVAMQVAPDGIRVNAVAPGPIETAMLQRAADAANGMKHIMAMVPLGRVGQPEEVANAILFLASKKASFITGSVIGVDGAMLA